MSDILHEISDDLRQMQLKAFWRDNGNWIIGGALLAVILTASMTFWRSYQADHNEAYTAALVKVLKTGDTEQILAEANKTGKSQAVVARFAAAGIHVKKGETDKAIAIYRDIRDMKRIDRDWRELAAVFEAAQTLEKADPAELHKLLKDATDKKATWRFSALELDALVYAREGKMKEAVDALEKIIGDKNVPSEIRARAITLRDIYAGE